MGTSTSCLRYIDNDYELVVRVSKELDRALKHDFDANQHELSQKITAVDEHFSNRTIGCMRKLVTLRNGLVHRYDINCLEDLNTSRVEFLELYDRVSNELERKKEQSRFLTNNSSDMVVATRRGQPEQAGGEGLSGWAMLGIGLAAAGMAAVAAAENSESRGENNRRRQDSHRSNDYYY